MPVIPKLSFKEKFFSISSLLLVVLILSLLAFSPNVSYGATYSEGFDTLSTGNLVGQDTWATVSGGSLVVTATTTNTSSPNSATKSSDTGGTQKRAIPASDFGLFEAQVYLSNNNDTGTIGSASISVGTSTNSQFGILSIRTDGNVRAINSLGTVLASSTVATAGWNTIKIEWEYTTSLVFSMYINDVLLHTYTSGFTGDIDTIGLQHGNSTPYFLVIDDLFVATDADVPISDYSSRIDSMTYATSTNEVFVEGYWNYHIPQTSNVDELKIYQTDVLGVTNVVTYTATSSGAFAFTYEYNGIATTASSSVTLAYDIDVTAELSRLDLNYYDPFGTEGLDPTGSLYKTLIQKETVTIGAETYDGNLDVRDIEGIYNLPEYACSLTELTGCLKNAFVWLFYPTQQASQGFENLKETLPSKFPFAYAYDFKNIMTALYTTTQTEDLSISYEFAGLGTLTLISEEMLSAVPYASFIKTILGYILWFIFSVTMYRRTLKLFDHNTTTQ